MLGRREVRMKRMVLVALVAVSGLLLARWWSADDSRGRLAFDRVWIDHLPGGERDPVNGLVLLRKQSFGVFQTASRWRGRYELFRHRGGERGAVEILYPHTGEREQVTLRAERCDRRGFDYCLEVRGASRGVKSYVSKKEWVVGSRGEADARLEELTR
jgi:hypothetical protein